MDEDRPDDAASQPDASRSRRAPPTIDLEATEVKTSAEGASDTGSGRRSSWLSPAAIAPLAGAAVTGAATAALIVAGAWALRSSEPRAEANAAVIEALASRLSDLEGRAAKPATPAVDPVLAGKLDALEKSLAGVRTELTNERGRSDKLAAAIDAVKSAPQAALAAPDLSAIEERLSQIERTSRAESEKAVPASVPADDVALRRLVVASMLDLSVRQGEPFVAALGAAKALAGDPQALKPLDSFAATGVPNPAALCRELLTLVPKLSPPAPASATTGSGIIDRLQAGATKLVRIERSDVAGNDRGAIVARVTAAAVRNDVADARRELNALTPEDRAPAQGWLDKVGERDAALAAAHRFTAAAMTALGKAGP